MKLGINNLYKNKITSRRFLIIHPQAELWGPLRAIPRGPWGAKFFFLQFFEFFFYSRAYRWITPSTKSIFLLQRLCCLFVGWREKGSYLFETSEFLGWMGNECIRTRYSTLKNIKIVVVWWFSFNWDINLTYWTKKNRKIGKKILGPHGPLGLALRGPHILARGWNIKKRLDDVICIPIKVVYAKFHPIWPSCFLWARFGFENR